MPKEAPPKAIGRWEGTQLYLRSDGRKGPRTVAQVREEAVAKAKADRDARQAALFNKNRRSSLPLASTRTAAASPQLQDNPEPSTSDSCPKPDASEPGSPNQDASDMPGSSKKKRAPSGAAGQTPDDANSDGIDPNLKAFLLSMKKDLIDSTNDAVGNLSRKVDENAAAITSLQREILEKEASIQTRIAAQVEEAISKISAPTPSTHSPPAVRGRRDAAYHHSRRSLKMWPISGDDLEDSVKVFLKTLLKFTDDRISALGSIAVGLPTSKAAKERQEVVATFESKEDRDTVKAAGVHLAGEKQAGMAIHVPGHLLDNLHALNSVAFSIKSNNAGVRRSVKYDDLLQDLFLDIFIGGKWKKITPSEAKAVLKTMPTGGSNSRTLSSKELSDLVMGEAVEGLTVITIPPDEQQ